MNPSIQLEQFNIGGAGCRDAHSERYFADGKRVTRDEFDTIKRDPRRRLECPDERESGRRDALLFNLAAFLPMNNPTQATAPATALHFTHAGKNYAVSLAQVERSLRRQTRAG